MRRFGVVAIVVGAVAFAPRAHAQPPLITGLGGPAGFGPHVVPPGDETSSPAIDVRPAFPSGIRFYGNVYNTMYVNTNGNVTFGAPLADVDPGRFPNADQPTIAPWWADVDTSSGAQAGRPAGNNAVYWHIQAGRIVVTWFLVGYARRHAERANTIQLVIVQAPPPASGGTIEVEFRYAQCQWTTGDPDGGSGGLGGATAQAGMSSGDMRHYFSLPGSLSLSSEVFARICGGTNVGTPGFWRFRAESVRPLCGNGYLETGEECDDGNLDDVDGCTSACVRPRGDAGTADGGPSFDAGRREDSGALPPDAMWPDGFWDFPDIGVRDGAGGSLDGGGGSDDGGGGGGMDGGGGGGMDGGGGGGMDGGGGGTMPPNGVDAFGGGCRAGARGSSGWGATLLLALALVTARRRARSLHRGRVAAR
jgi:cysteine-rich repeat protein